ncbi:polysaccharide deacetylase family protein [Aliikangiella maris]|uniref:Polysaccharide deacetylase family protein n=2 Tax=Aliikangiella maris TaxID=3162458 RepID=A0ABV2BTU4_9GAMM
MFAVNSNAAVVLQYHHIDLQTPSATSISPQLFREHMAYLASNQFNVIHLAQFIEYLRTQKPFPPKTVLITFDDGYQSVATQAAPILKTYGFPFTVFINTQPITEQSSLVMTWETLGKLAANGATIANHSVAHPHMIRRLANESDAQWNKRITNEVLQAQQLIEQHFPQKIRAFAYPYGEFNLALTKILKTLGFVGFAQHSGAVAVNVDQQVIPRFPFGGNYGDINDFILKVNTQALPITDIVLLDQNNRILTEHVLTNHQHRPQLQLQLDPTFKAVDIQCYLSGQGRLTKISLAENNWIFKPEKDIPFARSRYNCTAPTKVKGEFYWFSQPWIRPLQDGSWYTE